MTTELLGRSGEEIALKYLQEQGCRIIERNYRFKRGEIDLIARDRGTLCFVEVKTRHSEIFGSGTEAVSRSKQRRLTRLALLYLQDKKLFQTPSRFDVVVITWHEDNFPDIEWLKNAFDAQP